MLSNALIENIRPASVDLRLGAVFRRVAKHASLDAMPQTIPVPLPLTLQPGESVLAQTIESIEQRPALFACVLSPRSRAFRMGLAIDTNLFGPYYTGPITFGIRNSADYPITIRKYDSLLQIAFIEIRGETKPVEHDFQGGRVT